MATKLLAVQKLGKLFAHFFIRFDEKTKPAEVELALDTGF